MRSAMVWLVAVLLGIGMANSVLAGCGSCAKDKAKTEHSEPSADDVKKFDKDGDGKLNDAEKAELEKAHKAESKSEEKAK